MKPESDIHNTRELPNLKINELENAFSGQTKSGLPDLDFGSSKSADTAGSSGKGFTVELPEEEPERTASASTRTAPQPEPVHTEMKADPSAKTFNDDDFVIGKGFNITERYENISIRSVGDDYNGDGARNARRDPSQKNARTRADDTKPKRGNGKHGKKKQKSGCLGAFVWIFVILFISISLAVGAIFAVSDVFGIGKTGTSEVNIEMGSSTESIAESLKEAGAIRFPMLFRLYSKIKHTDGTYQYGLYSINNEGGYDGIIDQLQTEGPKADTVSIQIGDGWGIDKIAATMEENGVCTKSDFISAVRNTNFEYSFEKDIPSEMVYYRLEGYLHPDTYDFYVTENSKQGAEMAIRRMLEATNKYFTSENIAKAEKLGRSMHEILTLASIIQLEAGGADYADMQNVAAVFYNRLEDGMTLGSSPTTAYPYGNGRYNTYENAGLPPGPLCSVTENAINAALNPTADFDYYYFVTDAKGNFHYNKTLDEHNSTINSLQSSGNWLGDDPEDLQNMFK